MARVISKLNLNKTPMLAENNSLVCAKNIRVLKDGSIGPDTAVSDIGFISKLYDVEHPENDKTAVAHLLDEKGNIESEISAIKEAIEEITSEYEQYSDINVYKNYVENNNFDVYDELFSIEDLVDEDSDYYLDFKNGSGSTINDPKIVSKIQNKAKLLEALKAHNSNSSDKLLFPADIADPGSLSTLLSLYGGILTSKANNDMARTVGTLSSNFSTKTTYLEKVSFIKDNDSSYFNNHFFDTIDVKEDTDSTSPTYGEYVIDRYLLAYVAYFLLYHSEAIIEKVEQFRESYSGNINTYTTKLKQKQEELDKASAKLDDVNYYISCISDIVNHSQNLMIASVIPYNTKFYILCYDSNTGKSYIFEYDEINEALQVCKCNWTWGSGKIEGVCTLNLRGETVLSIAEYISDTASVPFKTINLSKSSHNDDESIYTQTPKVPLFNLSFAGYFPAKVSPGVYQFFIRYKISKDTYTNWFPASKELYTARSKKTVTNQGSLRYVDLDNDSDKGFILNVENPGILDNIFYESFQLGFIHSSKEGSVARAWKHFDINTEVIYFDRSKDYITEVNMDDMLLVNYGIYNVKNVTPFKTKLYISNYKETDFNPGDLAGYANGIDVDIKVISYSEADHIHYDNNDYSISVSETAFNKYINSIDGKTIYDIIKTFLDINTSAHDLENTILNGTYTDNILSFDGAYALSAKVKKEAGTFDVGVNDYIVKVYDKNDAALTVCIPSGLTIEYTDIIRCNSGDLDGIINTILRGGALHVNPDYSAINYNKVDGTYKVLITYNPRDNVFLEAILGRIEIMTATELYTLDFSFDNTALYWGNNNNFAQTLIPYQSYAFYIHYVKNTGEFTNGFKIGDDITIDYTPELKSASPGNVDKIIYPVFKFTEEFPEDYDGYFISVRRTKGNTIQIFGYDHSPAGESPYWVYGNALELDLNLEGATEDIPIKGLTSTDTLYTGTAKYYSSNNPYSLETFGASGKVVFDATGQSGIEDTDKFIVLDYSSDNEFIRLTKLTPIIKPVFENGYSIYDNLNDLNLPGFICYVEKPTTGEYNNYVAGSEWYTKAIVNSANNKHIELTEKQNTFGDITPTTTYRIYSNYNLDYVNLSNDLLPRIVKDNLVISIDSLTLSEVYSLNSMFYDYTRKLYNSFDEENNKTIFDNTIRSSVQIGDEDSVDIYKFLAADYYNVPVDKGKIVNLKAVGNYIIVHTEDSMFVFNGNNTLSANGGENVELKESEVFDTGIQAVFGSEFGFGGIRHKDHYIISENNYTFYDADSNNFYLFTGNTSINNISDNIRKLIDTFKITGINFANDYFNDRIFICMHSYDDGTKTTSYITLSYNFKVNSFVSIHDFMFTKSFNTKTKCYFISGNVIYSKDTVYNANGDFSSLYNISALYPSFIGQSLSKPYIDIICNLNYDRIKVLNYINWICSNVENFNKEITQQSTDDDKLKAVNMAEEDLSKYKGYGIQIYSNTTSTKVMLIGTDVDIDSIPKDERYLYSNVFPKDKPYYQLGRWNFNYFRNELNNEDLTHSGYIGYNGNSDNKSLLYGNYFVIRFVFDVSKNFKFEDLRINISSEYE